MTDIPPLVTIGVPTYNRGRLIARTIGSALDQDYPHVEIVISDNCSSDGTDLVCKAFASRDRRIKYVRQPRNLGATRNFQAVLQLASGSYFMWLGDDDYIDRNYVSATLKRLQMEPHAALVSGLVRYYRDNRPISIGRKFSITGRAWWIRIAKYYWRVSDNGVFYGLTRTVMIRRITLANAIGGDWLLVAGLAACGSIAMIEDTALHRELGGMSQSMKKTAKALALPTSHAVFPYISVAVAAFKDVSAGGSAYSSFGPTQRFAAGALAFCVLLVRAFTSSCAERLVLIRDRMFCRTRTS